MSDENQTATPAAPAPADATTTITPPAQAAADAPAPVAEPAPQAPPAGPAPVALGDVVVYHDYADVEHSRTVDRAAIVIATWGKDCANLKILGPTGEDTHRTSVSRGTSALTWSAKAGA